MAWKRFFLVIFMWLVYIYRGEAGQCQGENVDRLFKEAVCSPVATIVPLRMPGEEFSDLMPKHVMIKRCSGSCRQNSFYTCKPTSTSIVKVDVMLFSRSPGAGRSQSSCSVASIEQHESCTCGCLDDASSCMNHPLKEWVQEECRCSCANQWEKVQCLRKGWHWSSDDCQCWCPNPSGYPLCSTSYYYDYLNTCSCDCNPQLAWCAPTIPEILIVIVLASTIGTVMSISACYRYKIGLFKSKKREHCREPPDLRARDSLPLGHRGRARTWTGSFRKFSLKRPRELSKVGPEIILEQNELVDMDEPLIPSSELQVNRETSLSNSKYVSSEKDNPCEIVGASSENNTPSSGLNRMEKWGGLIRYKKENINLDDINEEQQQNVKGHIFKAEEPKECLATMVYPPNCVITMNQSKPIL